MADQVKIELRTVETKAGSGLAEVTFPGTTQPAFLGAVPVITNGIMGSDTIQLRSQHTRPFCCGGCSQEIKATRIRGILNQCTLIDGDVFPVSTLSYPLTKDFPFTRRWPRATMYAREVCLSGERQKAIVPVGFLKAMLDVGVIVYVIYPTTKSVIPGLRDCHYFAAARR